MSKKIFRIFEYVLIIHPWNIPAHLHCGSVICVGRAYLGGRSFRIMHMSGHRFRRNAGSIPPTTTLLVCVPPILAVPEPPSPTRPPAFLTRLQHGPYCGSYCLVFGPVLRRVRRTLFQSERALLYPPVASKQLRSEVSETNKFRLHL